MDILSRFSISAPKKDPKALGFRYESHAIPPKLFCKNINLEDEPHTFRIAILARLDFQHLDRNIDATHLVSNTELSA